MKKIRHILLFILALAMMVSMSAMCFPVSAETGSGSDTTATVWKFDDTFAIGAEGSTAVLENGCFGILQQDGKDSEDNPTALTTTVTKVNGVESIVDSIGRRAFSKSSTGIIDITPANGTSSLVYSKAPADGVYFFDVLLEKTAIPDGKKVKNWTEFGARKTLDTGFDAGWLYKNSAIGNDGDFKSDKLCADGRIELKAGEFLVIKINAQAGDGQDETQTTLKTFNVYRLEGGKIWSFGDEFKIGNEGSEAYLGNGYFGLRFEKNTLKTTVTKNGGIESIESIDGKRAFTKSSTGIIDITPADSNRSEVYFRAPVDGIYHFAAELSKTDIKAGEKVRNWTEVGIKNSLYTGFGVDTEALNVGVNYNGFGVGNDGTFTLKDVYFSGKASLKAGQLIAITVNAEGDSEETQTTLKDFVVYLASESELTYDVANPEKVNGKYTFAGTQPGTGVYDELEASPRIPAWNTGDEKFPTWYGALNSEYTYFAKSQFGGIVDANPKPYSASYIVYTASEAGIYHFDGVFYKGTDSPTEIIVAPNGDFANGAASSTSSTKGDTIYLNGEVELAKDEKLYFRISTTGDAASTEVAVKFLDVAFKGHECHEFEDDATCTTGATCKLCGKATGETNANNHTDTTEYVNNNNGTHTEQYKCCGAPVGEAVKHTLSSTDGRCTANCGYECPHDEKTTADCQAASKCEACYMVFGDKDMTNHTSTETKFVSNNSETHTEKHVCCDAPVGAAANHTLSSTDGKCTANCGYTCPHANKTEATCEAASKCEACYMVFGDKNADNHTKNTFVYVDNNDGTHTKKHECCNADAEAAKAHTVNPETGFCTATNCGYECPHTNKTTATCLAASECEACHMTFGEKDADNHTESTYPKNNGDGTHTLIYDCCEKPAGEAEDHVYGDDTICDVCYDGCDHEQFDENYTCTTCGYVCRHEAAEALRDCQTAPKCEVCDKQLEKDMTNHTSDDTKFVDNEDGTHTEKYACCETDIATNDHDWSNKDGKCAKCESECAHTTAPAANCVTAPVCPVCEKQLEKDMTKHTSTETEFVDNEDGTHTEKHACCGTEIATNNHDWTNKDGECAKCDATCAHANAPAADCKNASVCPTCGKTVADKDASKHVGTTVVVDNENGTHTEKYECCGAVVKADAKHDYTNGNCACGAKKPASKPSSPQTSDTAMSVAVALVAIAGVGIFALNSKKRRQK